MDFGLAVRSITDAVARNLCKVSGDLREWESEKEGSYVVHSSCKPVTFHNIVDLISSQEEDI